jgi:hypothetical protein
MKDSATPATPELLPLVLHYRIRQIISSGCARREMRGQQGAHLLDAMEKCFRKVTMLQARLHHLNNFSPEIVSTLGMHPSITDHRKLVRHRSDENEDGVPQWRLPHLQLREAMIGLLERMVDFSPADIDAYFAAGSSFGCGNRRHNSVVIDSLEEMMRFHAESLQESPATARTATATVPSSTGESTIATASSTASTSAAATTATNPPDPSGSA